MPVEFIGTHEQIHQKNVGVQNTKIAKWSKVEEKEMEMKEASIYS